MQADRRRSVSVFIYAVEPLRVLLLRRPVERAAGWQPVTGSVEAGDAAVPPSPLLRGAVPTGEIPQLAAACLREIREETGLPPPLELRDLGLETQFQGYDGATYHQRAFAARYADAIHPPRTPEHEEFRWLPLDDALPLLRWDEDKRALTRLRDAVAARPPPEP